MTKNCIDHHLCREHGANGIVITEMPPNTMHRFQVECDLCKRWISWCSEKQAEEFARRFGRRIRWRFRPQQPVPNVQLPALPTIRDTQRWAGMQDLDEFMQSLKDRHEKLQQQQRSASKADDQD